MALALRRHGVPEAILTDNGNGKGFTGRFGPGAGEVLFDRICRENGIKHLLTAPRSPTTTCKVERFHRTLRQEFLTGKTFMSIDDAQSHLDGSSSTTTSGPIRYRDGPADRTVHDRTREHSALANPGGRQNRTNAA